MNHIFFSYAHNDIWALRYFREKLQLKGLKSWTDELIEPGSSSWKIEVEKAIETAACVVALFSPNAKKSEYVSKELQYAKNYEIDVIPVWVLGEEVRDSIPLDYVDAQRIDARRDFASAVSQLIARILKLPTVEKEEPPQPPLSQDTLDRLTEIVLSENMEQLRHGAVVELVKLGTPDLALKVFLKGLESKDEDVCLGAILGLTQLGEIAVQPLIDVLRHTKDGDIERVRVLAATTLGLLEEVSVQRLIEMLQGSDEYGRELAAWTLGRIRDTTAANLLIELLKNEKETLTVRAYAATILGRVGNEETVEQLRDIRKKETSSTIRSVVHLVLIRLDAEDLSSSHRFTDVKAAVEALSSSDVGTWIDAAAEIGLASEDPEKREVAINALLVKLGNEREGVWLQISFSFWAIGKLAVSSLIEELPNEKDVLIRAYIGEILGEIGKDAVDDLLATQDNENLWKETWVKRAVIWALGWIKDEKARPLLEKYSQDKDADVAVQAYAAQALRKLNRKS